MSYSPNVSFIAWTGRSTVSNWWGGPVGDLLGTSIKRPLLGNAQGKRKVEGFLERNMKCWSGGGAFSNPVVEKEERVAINFFLERYFSFLKRFYLLIFREGKERNINVWLPLVCPLTPSATQAWILDLEWNRQPFGWQAGISSTEPHQPECNFFFAVCLTQYPHLIAI